MFDVQRSMFDVRPPNISRLATPLTITQDFHPFP
jgi:hypothetical protein